VTGDYNVNEDKEWRDRHPNPSGIPDDEPLVHEYGGQTYTAEKVPQPVPDEHHEEGHVPA
jgi:hypothetical protein